MKPKKPFNYTKAFCKASKHATPVTGPTWSEHKKQLIQDAKEKGAYRVGKQIIRATTEGK